MFYATVRGAFRVVARPMFRLRVEGVENVPATGPVLLVAPHRSWLDPPAIGGACPRPVRFLIVGHVFDRPLASWFYRRMGSIPLRGGVSSAMAVRAALRRLRDGEVVGIFPHGRVVPPGGSTAIQPGAALLAQRSGAPVVPVSLGGTEVAWPRGRRLPGPAPVVVRFGAPLTVAPGRGAAAADDLQARIESAVNADWPAAHRAGTA